MRFMSSWLCVQRRAFSVEAVLAAMRNEPLATPVRRLDLNTYLEAREQWRVLRLEAQIARCQLVVVDELGSLPLDKVGAEHLFGFFSQCYERLSLIVTTNLPFAEWPQVLFLQPEDAMEPLAVEIGAKHQQQKRQNGRQRQH